VERVTGIEPALSAWEADVLPLNYTRVRPHRLTLLPAWAVSAQISYRTRWVPRVLLRDRDSKAETGSARVEPDPYDPEPIQPSSIDVRMDRYFRIFENHCYPHIDPAVEQPDLTRLIETDAEEAFVLHPGEFVLASTYEVVSLPDDVAGRLEGKSSLGRLGLLTHSTAGWIDPGFSGHVTLELSNVATLPIKLWPGMKIGQLCLFRTSSPADHPYGSSVYGSRYQDQRGPTPSRSYLNFYRTKV
jgi:dCTP deaminase